MTRFRGLLCVLLLLASSRVFACEACGAFRAADGVQQPARILIFRVGQSSPDVFFDDTKIAARLNRAGHHVSRVESATDAQAGADVNIVLARADEIDRARAALADRCPTAAFLPVYEGFGESAPHTEPTLAANSPMRHILGVLVLAMRKLSPS